MLLASTPASVSISKSTLRIYNAYDVFPPLSTHTTVACLRLVHVQSLFYISSSTRYILVSSRPTTGVFFFYSSHLSRSLVCVDFASKESYEFDRSGDVRDNRFRPLLHGSRRFSLVLDGSRWSSTLDNDPVLFPDASFGSLRSSFESLPSVLTFSGSNEKRSFARSG